MTRPALRFLGAPGPIAAARLLNTAFFFITAVYCLLTYNPFTYEQFIRPKVSAALSGFALWHPSLHLLVASVTALSLAPFLDRRRLRWLGWSYLGASLVIGVWFFAHPLWRLDGTSRASLLLAIVSTLPPIWLAVFDYAAAGHNLRVTAGEDGRIWQSCWTTALFLFVVCAVAAPFRLRAPGGFPLPTDSLVLGWVVSIVGHLTVFTLVYLSLVVISGVAMWAGSPCRAQYRLLWASSATAVGVLLLRVVLAPVGIRGQAAWAVSALGGIALASAWSGVARHRIATDGSHPRDAYTALEAWLSPIALPAEANHSRLMRAAALGLAAAASHLLIARVSTFDWEFMLQKLVTLGLWLTAFCFVHALLGSGRAGPLSLGRRSARGATRLAAPAFVIASFALVPAASARLPQILGNPRLNPEFALDAYAAVDPSFRIARDMLGATASGDSAEFYAYLRAHSAIQGRAIEPVDIEFAHRLTSSGERPPHIFLFVIDSLRRDYVSPYNGAVTFTPALGAFAEDSFVFARAFSRYAGTGLAVPSIWAGAMLIHKQYVTPFAPMNALEKLIAAKRYRRFISEDHLTAALFEPSPHTIGLDRNVPEMLHTFCRTTRELGASLASIAADPEQPVFVFARPLDLHIGNVASAAVPAGESYPGFHGPYAARVRRIDECFGEFIGGLRRAGLYEDSVIVVTSDHGDSLGEGQRWGHGFTAFPEVLRIPLMIRLPARLRDRMSADLSRVSFSTDIVPTLYSLLGETPAFTDERSTRDLLLGSPLVVDPAVDLGWRRKEPYLVASSYGPVYGLLTRNGRRLYLADGIEGREYAFALGVDGVDVRVGITDAEREASRNEIRRQIAALAAWYGFAPEP